MAYGFEDDKQKVDLEDYIKEVLLASKPVGSIEINTSGVNPSTYIGGTWVAWGSGRVPVGVNTSETEFSTVEKTGGAKTHTLTVNQLPSHRHGTQTIIIHEANIKQGTGANVVAVSNPELPSGYTNYTGSGQAHNILQPYITCYMWKRTA